MTETVGKLLGMVLAYGVSSLGLLLAYYNYRKRIVKAEKIFTPRAKAVLYGVCGAALLGLTLGAAALSPGADTAVEKIGRQLPGIIVPIVVFSFSFWVTWMLFKHFMNQMKQPPRE